MYNAVYPSYITPYGGQINRTVKRKEDNEKSQSSMTRESRGMLENKRVSTSGDNFELSGYSQGRGTAIVPSSGTNSSNVQKINISQIITDFKNTTAAVGAPENITKEVNAYLNLIELQAGKENPDKKIIKSNLKSASRVLDGYISEALKKKSDVVETWVDALFLQKVDYKADNTAVNETLKLKFGNTQEPVEETVSVQPEKEILTGSAAELKTEEISEKSVPIETPKATAAEDISEQKSQELKMLIKTARNNVKNADPLVALKSLKTALDSAKEQNDDKAQARVYYETGNLYKQNGLYTRALKGYVKASGSSDNADITAKSELKAADIYRKAGMDDCAAEFYFSAAAYAGESGNIPVQVKALQNIAGIYASEADKKAALEYCALANELAEGNDKVKAYSMKKTAEVNKAFKNNSKALECLKYSTQAYSNEGDFENTIKNYISASDIMFAAGNPAKALNLLQKAYTMAAANNLDEYLTQIGQKIAELKY